MPMTRMGAAKADELNIVMNTTNSLNNVIVRKNYLEKKVIVKNSSRENQTR